MYISVRKVLFCWATILLMCLFAGLAADARGTGPMLVQSFDGPVTPAEINSFKAYVQGLTPAPNNVGNQWAQGNSGEDVKAMGLVYEISGNPAILDEMVTFCDALLSERNDTAAPPLGGHLIWTGRVDPVWPNTLTAMPISTGGEQGDPVGHLGNCALQILRTPDILRLPVRTGDPHRYGSTYLERARRYVREADYTVDRHILASLVHLMRDNRMYFSKKSPYQTGKPVPWNQQMMFDYGFMNLEACHRLLHDDEERVRRYHEIVAASLRWFFNDGATRYSDRAAKPAYDWGYAPPRKSGEDSNHGSLDAAGFYRLYQSRLYRITAERMLPFADTFVDVMTLAPGSYAGRVNGTNGSKHAAPTEYIRSGYLFYALFRPDAYRSMMSADLREGGTTTSVDQYSRFLWVKFQRHSPPR
jgi:hypothetical protein